MLYWQALGHIENTSQESPDWSGGGNGCPWQKLYEEAAVQTDFEKLPSDIAKAEQAIQQRLADNPPPLTDSAEFEAIGKTLAALVVLKTQIQTRKGHVET